MYVNDDADLKTTLAVAFSSDIIHILDREQPNKDVESVKVRCGRRLKDFSTGPIAGNFCERCGDIKTFESILDEISKQGQKLKKEREARKQQEKNERECRLERHRAATKYIAALLEGGGCTNIEIDNRAAGALVEFEFGGFKFKLNGNIWSFQTSR